MDLSKVIPALDWIRSMFLKGASFLSGLIDFPEANVYTILILLFAIFSSKKIIEFIYTTTDGKKIYWIILSALIFYAIKSLGVN